MYAMPGGSMLRVGIVALIVSLCGCAGRRYDRPWDIPAVRSIVREYGEPAAISQSSGDLQATVKWEHRNRLYPRWLDPLIELHYPDSRQTIITSGSSRTLIRRMTEEEALRFKDW